VPVYLAKNSDLPPVAPQPAELPEERTADAIVADEGAATALAIVAADGAATAAAIVAALGAATAAAIVAADGAATAAAISELAGPTPGILSIAIRKSPFHLCEK
jgi:hypothetical protein